MKYQPELEPSLRSKLYGKKAKRVSNKSIKKIRNKSFRRYLKSRSWQADPHLYKKNIGHEF